ncbi:DUF397 domain-containing protein [Sphaerisporangium siamense]|uniref:DUF397 domain-containing protein n=1 Tax=Sphaerisporangium siamense TaxID=795645 RepID=UPI0027DA4DD4|nr:DUF397 domain-containing protein [Sphaerisporangium siamense]
MKGRQAPGKHSPSRRRGPSGRRPWKNSPERSEGPLPGGERNHSFHRKDGSRLEESTPISWRESSYSNSNGGNCVEVATHSEGVAVRDSKNPGGPHLQVSPDAWTAFLNTLRM